MARKDRLVKSRTLYTIRKQHSVTRDGTIYENDYVTILPNDGNYDTDMDIFTESNFKYRLRTNDNSKKRHVRSEFVAGTSGDTWTLSGLSGHTASEEGRIVLKPDYSSMRDFAYYGSAVQMVRATVNDIVMRFPGGLSYYPDKTAPTVYISEGDRRYLVSNEFEIDCWSRVSDMPSGDSVNPMRILSLSYRNYVNASGSEIAEPVIEYNGSTCPNSIVGRVEIARHKFDIYMDGEGRKHLLTTGQTNGGGTDGEMIIRPKKELVDGFWNTMDDFERVLLNRDSVPVYKAVLDTPYSTDEGWFYKPRPYQWPTVETGAKAFTPDLTTVRFQSYLTSLITLAQYHDEHDSDNIVRMMTHEAIKNLDWSFTSWRDGEASEENGIDSGRISAALRVWGRAFDDIKRYAAGIKQSVNVSYDEKGNMPDYFLTDRNGNEGWMAVNTVPYAGAVSDAVRIAGHDLIRSGMTAAFVNTVFQRSLYLNSRYIHSLKGTRRGIETLLGLFGYRPASGGSTAPGTFSISEYVCIVGSGLSYSEASRYRALGEYAYDDATDNLMHGYPVVQIFPPGKTLSSESYIMPWFDPDEEYRNPLYFQEKGGWGERRSRQINLPSLTTAVTITAGATLDLYGETWPYMMYATDTADMLSIPDARLRKNAVCYVEDISGLDGVYVWKNDEKWKNGEKRKFSHYFVLKNTALSSHLGYVDNDLYSCYGWRNVPLDEIEAAGQNKVDRYEDGLRVLYMESLTSVQDGNNPHTGVGEYDDGEGYKNRFRKLFQNAFDEGLYDYLKNENEKDYERLREGYGFELTEKEDNRKCAFYADAQDDYRIKPVDGESVSAWNADIDGLTNPEPGGKKTTKDGFIDEACATAVMNVKKLVIRFNTGGNAEFRNYLQNVVFRYLEEMIPATAILSYAFDTEETAIRGRVTTTPGRTRRARAAGVMVTGGDAGAVLHDDGIRKVSL